MKCPKCGGEMEEGIIADYYQPLTYRVQFWGKKMAGGILGSGLFKMQDAKETKTLRCQTCGYCEIYAK